MKNETNARMAGLAEHLPHQRKSIPKRWRTATEEAPGVTISSTLTRVQFNDHIPGDPAMRICRRARVNPQGPYTIGRLKTGTGSGP
jgi:hypothetical protein